MKKISLWVFLLAFTVCAARGQDAATQEQIGKLSGHVQDMLEAQAAQAKRISALEKEINELRDKLNQPAVNDSASTEDLKKLAAQVQEIDRKRQADNERILKAIEKLGKAGAGASPTRKPPVVSTDPPAPAPVPGSKQMGYDYEILHGDTLSTIAKKYREQGVKVTTTQIIAANPGLNPNALIAGKKIFIPDPNAK